jgi:5-methyltetrahydrofolate--homocysteine methyltransferase
MTEQIFTDISDYIVKGDLPVLEAAIRAALDNGIDPAVIMNEGLINGMGRVSALYEKKEYFLPEVLYSARAMKAALEILRPLLAKSGFASRGKVVLGTVQGDLHDIGKNVVKITLEGAGFEAIDLGNDVSPEAFVDMVKESGARVLGMSALLTTTRRAMKTTIDRLAEEGIRKNVVVMIGGAAVTERYAADIGADGWAKDAAQATERIRKFLGL